MNMIYRIYKIGFLCATSVFSASLWFISSLTTETQRTQRLHREAVQIFSFLLSLSSNLFISPLSLSWSYPQRCSSPCSINCSISFLSVNPFSCACAAAVSTAIAMSPRFNSSSAGNDKTSVVLSIPRNSRLSSRIFLSETKAIVAEESLFPIVLRAFSAKLDHASVSSGKRLWRFTTSIIATSDSSCPALRTRE